MTEAEPPLDAARFLRALAAARIHPQMALHPPVVVRLLRKPYREDSAEYWRQLYELRPSFLLEVYHRLDEATQRQVRGERTPEGLRDAYIAMELPVKATSRPNKYIFSCLEGYRRGEYNQALYWELLLIGLTEGQVRDIRDSMAPKMLRRIEGFLS